METRTKGIDEKYCTECGSIIRKKAEICPHCGVRVSNYSLLEGKNRIVAALFALFLGGFGIHKFYLGQKGKGILYILFCWTFIPSLVGFIEGIIYLLSSDEDFQAKYS